MYPLMIGNTSAVTRKICRISGIWYEDDSPVELTSFVFGWNSGFK